MFKINEDLSIYATRGDVVFFTVAAKSNGTNYKFAEGDVVRIKVFEKNGCDCVMLQKDFVVPEEMYEVYVWLAKEDTKMGELISKPKDYWYEVELNPDTQPMTIVGYDENGAKVFRLFPEGADVNA